MIFYRKLLNVVIEDSIKLKFVTNESAIVAHYRKDLVDTIKALGKRDTEIAKFGYDIRKKTEDLSRLSIASNGADIYFCLDGEPMVQDRGNNAEVLSVLIALTEEKFKKLMKTENSWFLYPGEWKVSTDTERFLINSDVILKDIQRTYPFWNLPDDPAQIVKLLLTGELGEQALQAKVLREKIIDNYRPGGEYSGLFAQISRAAEMQSKVVKEEGQQKKKKDKKKNKNPQPQQNRKFGKKRMPLRVEPPLSVLKEAQKILEVVPPPEIMVVPEAYPIEPGDLTVIDSDIVSADQDIEIPAVSKDVTLQESESVEIETPLNHREEIIQLVNGILNKLNPDIKIFRRTNTIWTSEPEFQEAYEKLNDNESNEFENFLFGNAGIAESKKSGIPGSAFVDFSGEEPILYLCESAYPNIEKDSFDSRAHSELRLAADVISSAISSSKKLQEYPKDTQVELLLGDGVISKGEEWKRKHPSVDPEKIKPGVQALRDIIFSDDSGEVFAQGMNLIFRTSIDIGKGRETQSVKVLGDELDQAVSKYITSKIVSQMALDLTAFYPPEQVAESERRFRQLLVGLEGGNGESQRTEDFLANIKVRGLNKTLNLYLSGKIPEQFLQAKKRTPSLSYSI